MNKAPVFRSVFKFALVALVILLISCKEKLTEETPTTAVKAPTSWLIFNVTVIDGSGTPGEPGSVRIDGSKIIAVGDLQALADEQVVDGGGQVIAPGFIDTHSHADDQIMEQRDVLAAVGQGITTVIVGQDGGAPFPLASCRYQPRCCQSKKGHARSITCDDKEPLRQQMNSKMEKDDSKAVYKERKVIVEPVIGQIKNTGFRGFSVRGKEKVAGELSLVCAVHNIKKIARAMVRGVVRQEHGRLVENHGI